MLKLTNGSLCRPTIGVLGAALAMACAVPAMAEPGSTTAPAAQNSGQTMGAMKQQMMQQMQTCMNQMPPMSGTDLSCPRLSGPPTMIVWIMKGTTNAEQEAQAGRDHREAA